MELFSQRRRIEIMVCVEGRMQVEDPTKIRGAWKGNHKEKSGTDGWKF
jgi:tRNA threonylcarbamoyladenosine modification (KEOPS) complex Cgi121 subunit